MHKKYTEGTCDQWDGEAGDSSHFYIVTMTMYNLF